MSATYTAMPVTGCPPIESPALLLRPASRDCHEICRYSPIKPYVSEYRKRAAFSYTDTPLYREGLVTRGRYVCVYILPRRRRQGHEVRKIENGNLEIQMAQI